MSKSASKPEISTSKSPQKTVDQAATDNVELPSPELPSSNSLASKIVRVKIDDIVVPEERRKHDNAKASELMESIRFLGGVINPLTVRETPKGYVLVAGARRLEAMKQLGYTEIECVVLDCDELKSELAEIDENLIRNEIADPITIGELANRRDEILEELGLRAKPGDNQHTNGGGADSAPPKTTADIAKEVGIGERTMQVNKQLARDLIPEAKEVVREKGITKADAIALSGFTEDQQRDVIDNDDKKAIIAAIRKIHADGKKQKGTAKPWSVERLLEKVSKTYDDYSEDEQKESLMAGLWEFMVEFGYIEPEDVSV